MIRCMLLAILMIPFLGCSTIREWSKNQLEAEHRSELAGQERYEKNGIDRVEYITLKNVTDKKDWNDVIALLDKPEKTFDKIGIFRIHKTSDRDTMDSLLRFSRQKCAANGADAVIVLKMGADVTGAQSWANAGPLFNSAFSLSQTNFTYGKEEVSGIAIKFTGIKN